MLAGCLLLTMRMAASAADDVDPEDVISAPSPLRPIPILSGTGQAENSSGHFQATVNPLVVVRVPNAQGALADSANEYVDFGWHLPIFSLFTIGYDTGVNAFRQDQTIWDDDEATSQVTSALINKVSIEADAGPALKWTNYVQGQRGMTDGQTGYTDATKYGTQAAWTPVKDVTTVKVDASTQETYNFNQSILDEDLTTASLDQKLPYIPVTLHTGASLIEDTSPLLSAGDKNNTVIDASLLWKIVATTAYSIGVQRQDTTLPAAGQLSNSDIYFTQIALQPAQAWSVTARAARELREASESGQFLSNGSDVLLSLGMTWKLNDHFNAGAGLNYRLLQSSTPAPASNAPPATISLSAGGNF